eukprot:scaffold3022_cov42-Cyclotella_meneghiniana.AAC.9
MSLVLRETLNACLVSDIAHVRVRGPPHVWFNLEQCAALRRNILCVVHVDNSNVLVNTCGQRWQLLGGTVMMGRATVVQARWRRRYVPRLVQDMLWLWRGMGVVGGGGGGSCW